MASAQAAARGFRLALVACALLAGAACRPDAQREVTVSWAIEPAPPVTGTETIAVITLQDEQKQPVRGAKLQLEAHMSHPGMAPVTSGMTERADGTYEGRLQLSMAGDWILVVTGELPDGRRITRQLELSGVRPAG